MPMFFLTQLAVCAMSKTKTILFWYVLKTAKVIITNFDSVSQIVGRAPLVGDMRYWRWRV